MASGEASDLDVAKQRSPAFPYISLELALDRANKIYARVRDTAQPREVMATAYGKPATSSATMQTFATLIQYGLLETLSYNGQRRLKISALARSLVHPNAPNDVFRAGLKTAALNPAVFKELWDRYGDMADLHDSVALYYLTHDRQQELGSVFTERAAEEVLRVYRATLNFAGLSDSDKTGLGEAVAPEGDVDEREAVRATPIDNLRPIPHSTRGRRLEMTESERELQTGMLSKTASYRVIVTGRIGAKEIDRLIKRLEMDKEILADDADDEPDEAASAI